MSVSKTFLVKNCSGVSQGVVVDGVTLTIEPGDELELFAKEVIYSYASWQGRMRPNCQYILGDKTVFINEFADLQGYFKSGVLIALPFIGAALVIIVLRLLNRPTGGDL